MLPARQLGFAGLRPLAAIDGRGETGTMLRFPLWVTLGELLAAFVERPECVANIAHDTLRLVAAALLAGRGLEGGRGCG